VAQFRRTLKAWKQQALVYFVPGAPVLVLRSTSYAGERPVEVFVAYHRGDRSRFEVTLQRTRRRPRPPEPLMRVTA